jgi:isopentenyldiphosphate isomerase
MGGTRSTHWVYDKYTLILKRVNRDKSVSFDMFMFDQAELTLLFQRTAHKFAWNESKSIKYSFCSCL